MLIRSYKHPFGALLFSLLVFSSATAMSADKGELSTVTDIMLQMTIPSSDSLWSVEEEPQDDAGWKLVLDQANILAESGRLLLHEDHLRAGEEWSTQAQALVEAANLAAEATRNRNFDQLMEAGEPMYESCESCHAIYQEQP
jgi:cytochrome c556